MWKSSSSGLWTKVVLESNWRGFVVNPCLSSSPLLDSGWRLPDTLLGPINSYITAPTCLNQSADIFIQPSPFEAVELIKLTLKYSLTPVDILVMGTMTNLAAAIAEDRSIIPKIGTLYFSGSLFAWLFFCRNTSLRFFSCRWSIQIYPWLSITCTRFENHDFSVLAKTLRNQF